MNEINKYYQSLIQDIVALQASNEEGDTQEQTFTRIAVDMLAEAGETEKAAIAYDEKALGTRNQHKINAYAISDNYETVDLFISIFDSSGEIKTVAKADIDTATKRIINFFVKLFTTTMLMKLRNRRQSLSLPILWQIFLNSKKILCASMP